MDRGKNLPAKASKSKPLGFPADFIALGSKSGRPAESGDVKIKTTASSSAASAVKSSPTPLASSSNSSDRKRENPSSSAALAAVATKKPKPGLSGPGTLTALGRPTPKSVEISTASNLNQPERWEEIAIEVEGIEILNSIGEAENNEDEEKIEAILCGAVKQIRASCFTQRTKTDPVLTLALLYLAKWRPHYFNTETIVEALLVLLKRDMTAGLGPFKGKMASTAASLACNLLLAAFQDERSWPESFIKVFIEDSIGDRIWVDREECQGFVENILTAFNTKIPPKNILQQEGGTLGPSGATAASSSPNVAAMLGIDEEASVDSDISQGASRGSTNSEQQFQVLPRYQGMMDTAETLVLDVAKEQFSRRQQPVTDVITRNFLKFLASTAGISEIRVLAAQRLELWMSNPKLSRPAADLLLSICVNCSTSPTDTDVFNALIRLRLKTKPLVQTYLTCLKELVEQQPDQLPILLRVLIFNELSQQQLRGLNNMPVLGVLVQHWPERTASYLADIFVELLLNRDDYLRALRGLLREMVRNLRQDLPLTAFCSSLLHATFREHREQIIRDFEFKDRLMTSLMDLTTLCIFLAVSPSVRESASLVARGDLREMELLRQFQGQATAMQRESVKWLFKAVPLLFRPNRPEYVHCLHKVLFMEAIEQYYNKDGWPNEVDRSILLRLSSEIPVLEDTLINILQIGLSKDHPLPAPDALELCDQLLRRCAAAPHQGLAMLQAQKQDIFDMMLSLTAYHHPENIVLPQGYNPPELAISTLYWKAWLMLLLLTAHNPNSFGSAAWDQYPTLRSLMEMCITNNYTVSGGSLSEQQELQIAAMEKQTILEFETHLAAASTKITITESNSLLLSQLTSLNPRGPARRPPHAVLEQLRASNATLRLGHLLCRSRNPDFLLDILHRQGPAQSMPWLADLVESNEGAWSLLPVQCLCEFLLHQAAEEVNATASLSGTDGMDDSSNKLAKRKERRHKQQQLIEHLGLLLKDPNQTPDSCREVLDYLMRRLGAQQALARQQAAIGLSLVLSVKEEDIGLGESTSAEGPSDETQYNWLLHQLPTIAHFQAARPAVIAALRTALQMETQPRAVASYLRFLSTHAIEDPLQELGDLAFDLAQLIVERSSLVSALLPSPSNRKRGAKTLECLLMLFWHYIQKAREPNKEAYSWSENQDQVLVQWQSGEAATLHILVVHAMVILLTYGPPQFDQPQPSCFYNLLEVWFPNNGEVPQAFLVETSEEALLYPDWLKLRMIRSNVEALVDGALKDLEPGQLILFIQSFGIPVTSISKLLQALDRMVQVNPFAFVEVEMDKAYMQQLLQVQWQRGARGGIQFADIMQLNEPEVNVKIERNDAHIINRPSLNVSHSVTGALAATPPLQPEYVASILLKLFDTGTVLRFSQQEKMEAFRVLSKMLAAEVRSPMKPSIEAATSAFDGLLNSPGVTPNESEMLLLAMERQPAFSCGLLRLLTSAASSVGPSPLLAAVLRICNKMVDRNRTPNARSPLRNIAKSFVDRFGSSSKSGSTELQKLDLSSGQLEKHVQQLSAAALENNDTRSLVSNLVNSLSDSQKGDRFVGLLIDWLELMDPEIITAHPDLQQNLLFGQSSAFNSSPTCRPYLLSLLIHQASWTTLRQCIQQLLGCRVDSDVYQPSVVLDFLSASIQVPKLWQGRDKHVPKHQKPENLLCLNQQQLTRLATYIMSEYEQVVNSSDNQNALQILENRSQLLLSCCGASAKVEVLLARAVAKEMTLGRNEMRKKAAQQLMLQLYVRAPHVATRIPDIISTIENNSTALTSVPCAVDSMLLTLISSLASPQPGKDGTRRMADLETALRKIAATHPLLLLRQFPSLAGGLRGRAHLDLFVLRSRNHLSLFSCVLGLAHKLKTHLFAPEHRVAFEDMLNSFWTLFDFQRSSKELYTLLQQFIQLLLNYIAVSPFAATHYLQKYASLLQDLQVTHPEMQMIKELRSALSLPRPADNEADVQSAAMSMNRSGIRLGPILSRLRQSDNHEEVIQVLQDVENVCSRTACAPLEDALDDLRPLMSSPNTVIRNMTYSLVLRYLGDQPHAAVDLLPDYLDCLDNPNSAVVSTALQRLPDFLLLCQEHGNVLLQKAFSLAVESGFHTLPNLSEALMLLQLQSGT